MSINYDLLARYLVSIRRFQYSKVIAYLTLDFFSWQLWIQCYLDKLLELEVLGGDHPLAVVDRVVSPRYLTQTHKIITIATENRLQRWIFHYFVFGAGHTRILLSSDVYLLLQLVLKLMLAF